MIVGISLLFCHTVLYMMSAQGLPGGGPGGAGGGDPDAVPGPRLSGQGNDYSYY